MMSPLDQRTLGWKTPRTIDGRRYPAHLRAYEQFDAEILPLLADLGHATFDDLSIRVADPKVRAVLPRWLASAEWRSIVERHGPSAHQPRTYELGPRAKTSRAA
jgi:hypothetical protein